MEPFASGWTPITWQPARSAFEGQGNSGNQPASADWNQHGEIGVELLGQFQSDRAVTRDRFLGIVGMQQQPARLSLDAKRRVPAVFKGVFAKHDLSTELSGTLDLERRGVLHHHDLGADAELAGGVGHGLREVAGGRSDDTRLASLIEAGQHAIERGPDFERSGRLLRLEFEPHPPAGRAAQSFGKHQRSGLEAGRQPFPGLADLFDCHGCAGV